MTKNKINIVVLGASGYTGGDLIRILIGHEKAKILAWIGSGGVGFNLNWSTIVAPIKSDHIPIIKKDGKSIGINPNKLKIEYGSGADKSFIHP